MSTGLLGDRGAGHKRTRGSGKKAKTASSARTHTMPRDKKPTGAYRHRGSRKNLPTDQTARNMGTKDTKPIPYKRPLPAPSRLPKDLRPPHLVWERDQPDHTQASPLHIHEKLNPAAFALSLKRDHDHNLASLFSSFDGIPKGAEFEWYQHRARWQNRLIRGESRHVMASLLKKEGLAGKVQMVYFDPPYGIDFRMILQANMDRNEDQDEIPNDPVAVQTFRDTYKNGMHSYLDNIYQIGIHARELLSETGSLFLQIGSANVNRVAIVLDEVFGAENRMGMIPFATKMSSSSSGLPNVTDYLLWYAKSAPDVKYHQLYEEFENKQDVLSVMSFAALLELKDGTVKNLTPEQKSDPDNSIPSDAKLFRQTSLTSQGYSSTRTHDYKWNNKTWKCPRDRQWSIDDKGLDKLAELNRLYGSGTLNWKKYQGDFPGRKVNNLWGKQKALRDKHYVVETAEATIERCILMTTDPGDLVFDPTCGSGTTAFVAETWGRRWITSDVGLVAINLARQRLITGVFPWYKLIDSEAGRRRENELRSQAHQPPLPKPSTYNEDDPSSGFVYERLPRVSPKFLAYPGLETPVDYMVDRAELDEKRIRVSSPFTIESLSPYRYVNPQQTEVTQPSPIRHNIVEVLRETGIRVGKTNIRLTDIQEYPGRMITHMGTFDGKKACIVVANDDCTVPPVMVDHAVEEAAAMPYVEALIMVAFNYEPTVKNEKRGRISVYKVMPNHDLIVGNLKSEKEDIAFVIVGEPDVKVEIHDDMATVEIIGYDTFNPGSGITRPGTKKDVYCWMIDTEYDGRSFFVRRIHFPGTNKDKQIDRFYKAMAKRIDDDRWESFRSLRSAPFTMPKSGRIAVKIITSTHTEMTTEIDMLNTGRL